LDIIPDRMIFISGNKYPKHIHVDRFWKHIRGNKYPRHISTWIEWSHINTDGNWSSIRGNKYPRHINMNKYPNIST